MTIYEEHYMPDRVSIERIREDINEKLFSCGLLSPEDGKESSIAHQLSMAATELMENACKHGIKKKAFIHIDAEEGNVNILSENCSKEKAAQELSSFFKQINANDVSKLYKEMALNASYEKSISRLGLIRIMFELSADLVYKIVEENDKRMRVRLLIRIPLKEIMESNDAGY